MAIRFQELKRYLARNVRLSICFEDGHYHNYLMVSDIPDNKYDNLYVYGIGMIDVEFSMDVYTKPQEQEGIIMSTKDDILRPALEIVLHKEPRETERSVEKFLLFKDIKPYLQIWGNFTVLDRKDWSGEEYEDKDEIPSRYDNMFVYGINIEDNHSTGGWALKSDTVLKMRMLFILSDSPRADIVFGISNRKENIEIGKRIQK